MDCIAGIHFYTGFRLLCETWEVLVVSERAPVYGSVSLTEDSAYYPTSAFHPGLLYCGGISAAFRFLCLHINASGVSAQFYRIGTEVSPFGEQGRE